MPWKSRDATKFTKKAKTPTVKRQFAHVANAALKKGKSEGTAVRMANAAVAKRGRKK